MNPWPIFFALNGRGRGGRGGVGGGLAQVREHGPDPVAPRTEARATGPVRGRGQGQSASATGRRQGPPPRSLVARGLRRGLAQVREQGPGPVAPRTVWSSLSITCSNFLSLFGCDQMFSFEIGNNMERCLLCHMNVLPCRIHSDNPVCDRLISPSFSHVKKWSS